MLHPGPKIRAYEMLYICQLLRMILYRFLYRIFIAAYVALIRLAALWNPKARLWINGRKNIVTTLQQDLGNQTAPTIWMHCASLGEFEQGKPVLDRLRNVYPKHKIVLTFFSPSGYTIIKGKPVADYIFYLPLGGRRRCGQFIDLVKPAVVLWVKYEYWYYYLDELKRRNVALLLISGNFQDRHPFFKWYGTMHRRMLECFTHLFVQTRDSKILLGSIGFSHNVSVAGDTRFDRVTEIAERFEAIDAIEIFCGKDQVIVAGSTWPEDEEELDHFANVHPELKFILAPHEIHEEHLKDIERLFKRTIRYSQFVVQLAEGRWSETESPGADEVPGRLPTDLPALENSRPNVLIIDNIGMLSRLYQYATIAYVGGGFGEDGVHNVLEAAVYGKPVIFGPVYKKYIEAVELVEEAGAYTIDTAIELEKTFNDLLQDQSLYAAVCEASKKYVYSKKGATQMIMRYIQENRLLTN